MVQYCAPPQTLVPIGSFPFQKEIQHDTQLVTPQDLFQVDFKASFRPQLHNKQTIHKKGSKVKRS